MKKIALVALALALVFPLYASYHRSWKMLPTPVNCAANTIIINRVNFWAGHIPIGSERQARECSATITFTRAAGSASTVDFEFEVSTDNRVTWSLLREPDALDTPLVQIPTNTPVVSGTTVQATFYFNLPGVSHIRLRSINNNDTVNNLTAINVTLSL